MEKEISKSTLKGGIYSVGKSIKNYGLSLLAAGYMALGNSYANDSKGIGLPHPDATVPAIPALSPTERDHSTESSLDNLAEELFQEQIDTEVPLEVTASSTNNVQRLKSNNKGNFYGKLGAGSTVALEAIYQNPQWGVAVFGEDGAVGIKGGLFDLTNYNLDASSAVYLGDRATGISTDVSRDTPFGNGWNIVGGAGVSYFKTDEKDITNIRLRTALEKRVGNYFNANLELQYNSNKELTGDNVQVVVSVSYPSRSPENTMPHTYGTGGLQGRLLGTKSKTKTTETHYGSPGSGSGSPSDPKAPDPKAPDPTPTRPQGGDTGSNLVGS
jgi:hypothetical protein